MITYYDKYDSEYNEYIHVHENLSPNTDDVTRCLPYHSNVRHAPMSQFNRSQCVRKCVQVGTLIVDWTLHQLIRSSKVVLLQQDVCVFTCGHSQIRVS